MDEQTGKEKYLERRVAKDKAREEARRTTKRSKVVRNTRSYAIVVAAIFLLGYGVFLLARTTAPKSQDYSRAISIQGEQHIEVGATHPQHSSNPPSSGWHYANTLPIGFYEESVADEYVIHNLEHGDVWIAYKPQLPESVINALKDFSGGSKVIVTPREANEFDISLTAWGRIDGFNVGDESALSDEQFERVEDFIKRYRNKGPEKVPSIRRN